MKRPKFFYQVDTGGNMGGSGGGDGGSGTLLSGAGTTAPAAPAATSWISDDGTFGDGWTDRLPEDLRNEPSLRVLPSFGEMAKSYVATKKLVGTKLEMPGEGATPEAVASWRKTVGAPEAPEGYLGDAKTLRPDSIPENMWDAESEKGFLALAHKHSLPPQAVKEIIAYHADALGKGIEGVTAGERASLDAEGVKLKTAFGADFDARMSDASRLAKTLGLDPATNPIFQSAEVVQAFARGAKLFSEDRLVAGEAPSMASSISGRVSDITDMQSQSMVAREYRGEFGQERQSAAQATLHQLMAAQAQK